MLIFTVPQYNCLKFLLQVLCIQILRCLVQPLGEKVVGLSPGDIEKPKHADRHGTDSGLKQRLDFFLSEWWIIIYSN